MAVNSKSDQNKSVFEPIKSNADIERIRSNLRHNPRDLLLFNIAVQTGIGMKKLLQLKVRDLIGVKVGGKIPIEPSKDKKYSVIMTEIVHDTFNRYLAEINPKPDDYLFRSKKGQRPLNLPSVSNMIKGWFEAANIKNCNGAISLRKTWEYNQRNKTHVNKDIAPPAHKDIFKPIKMVSVQKIIYDELFRAIISGKISPGTRLTTREISKSFNVSHAPVRVALNWLEARGFIESQKKMGSIVKELTVEELQEIIKIRMILETAAAKLSYKVCTEETLNLLESITQRYKIAHEREADFEEIDHLNRLFHQTLYRDANMPLLVTIITDLYDRFSPYAAFAFLNKRELFNDNFDQVKPETYHIKIIEGMRRKNLNNLLKPLKMKIDRARKFTEEVFKERKGGLFTGQ